jgi:hypothetical protein
MTDRGFWLAARGIALNVRRLMYQSLIWLGILSDDPRRLCAALDAEDRQGLPNALVDRMRRYTELDGDLLGAEVLVDQPQAVQLPGRKTAHAVSAGVGDDRFRRLPMVIRQAVRFVQIYPHIAQHGATPEQRVSGDLMSLAAQSP